MVALLDVNVLVALIDSVHRFHRTAKDWALKNGSSGWASCPLTQNGCIRIVIQPGYPGPATMQQAIQTLLSLWQSPHHQFWCDEMSLLDANAFDHSKIYGHRQLTYLNMLGLAVKHQGRFVTLDSATLLSPVKGAKKQHVTEL